VGAQVFLLNQQRHLQNSLKNLLMALLKRLPHSALRVDGGQAGMLIHVRGNLAQGS